MAQKGAQASGLDRVCAVIAMGDGEILGRGGLGAGASLAKMDG